MKLGFLFLLFAAVFIGSTMPDKAYALSRKPDKDESASNAQAKSTQQPQSRDMQMATGQIKPVNEVPEHQE